MSLQAGGLPFRVCTVGIALLFMPWSPAALVWPYEWIIVGGWIALGVVMVTIARLQGGGPGAPHV